MSDKSLKDILENIHCGCCDGCCRIDIFDAESALPAIKKLLLERVQEQNAYLDYDDEKIIRVDDIKKMIEEL